MKTLLIPFLVCLFLGCKTSPANPCDGLMNQSPPLRIGLVLFDKHTGDNLFQTNVLKEDDIKVTVLQTGNVVRNWRVINSPNSPLNGVLEFAMFHETAGEYVYKIELKKRGTINLSYIITQEKTNDPCKMYSYPINNIKVLNHDFEQFKYEGKTSPNILAVKLDL